MKLSIALCLVSILGGCARVEEPPALSAAAARGPGPVLRRSSDTAEKVAVDARSQRIQGEQSAIDAGERLALERDKVIYLLGILPEHVADSCNEAAPLVKCQLEAQAISVEFESTLALSDPNYNEQQALALYEASRKKATEAQSLEFNCLLDKIGSDADTRRELEQTLKSLEEREKLVVQAGLKDALPCLDRGVEQYQTLIGEDHQQFSRAPALTTQAQLHRDLRGEFEAQIACLQSAPPERPTAANN
jgi:hypothetical protein